MSRVSRKSELSPSSTSRSNSIDTEKDSSVDMGRKSEPSITSGGIGVTQDITNIGGVTVTGGVSVDISPLDIGISFDPSGSVSVAIGAEIPGGIFGVSGGATIDLNTGEVTGGSIGGEALGLGVSISNSKEGGLGIEFSLQIPFTPIEINLGFGSSPKKPRQPISTPTLPPTLPPGALTPEQIDQGMQSSPCGSLCVIWINFFDAGDTGQPTGREGVCVKARSVRNSVTGKLTNQTVTSWESEYNDWVWDDEVKGSLSSWFKPILDNSIGTDRDYFLVDSLTRTRCFPSTPSPSPSPSPSSYPSPFPNPPPRKRNMDECCRDSIKLQRLIVRHLGAARTNIQEILPDGVEAIGSVQQGIPQSFPFKVKKKWINPTAKDEENIAILNARHLTLVLGGMMERLERVLGTAEFYKDSDKKLRQSEGNLLSWFSGNNPDFKYPDPNDFWLNTDDGIINEKKLEVRSIADGLRYQIEALNRLERILPIAELKDSSIPARWIHPNGKGQLRVGNLIHLCEYMIRKDDRDRGYWPQKIKIKDADPTVEGDQPYEIEFQSQADMMRTMFQMIVDTEGDVDLGSNYDLRRTYLDMMAFQLTVKNNKYLQAILEYLNFDIIETVDKVPVPFDPFAGQNRSLIEQFWNKYGFGDGDEAKFPKGNTESEIEKLSEGILQNSEIEIATVKFGSEGATKDPRTLNETLLEILKHSSASAAAVTEKVSEGALDKVVEAAGLAQKLTSFLLRRDVRESLGIGDLDNWISSAEKGYTDNPESESLRFPESDSAAPYGRPATQNPTIREIDTKDPKAD